MATAKQLRDSIRALGLTTAQAKVLAKLAAGKDVSGGMAGVALLAKNMVEKTPGHYWHYNLTEAGRDMLAQLRRIGW